MTEFMVQESPATALPNDVVLRQIQSGQKQVTLLDTQQCTVTASVTLVDRFIDPNRTIQEFLKYRIVYSVNDHRFNPTTGPDYCGPVPRKVDFGADASLDVSDGSEATVITFVAESIPNGNGEQLRAGECVIMGGTECIHHFSLKNTPEYALADSWKQLKEKFGKAGVKPSDLEMIVIPKEEHDKQQTPPPPYRSGGMITDLE